MQGGSGHIYLLFALFSVSGVRYACCNELAGRRRRRRRRMTKFFGVRLEKWVEIRL